VTVTSTTRTPGALSSAYERLRYRSRLFRLALRLKSRPSLSELVGFLGLSAFLAFIMGLLTGLGLFIGGGIAAAGILLLAFLLERRVARISYVFSVAQRSDDGLRRLLQAMTQGMQNDHAYEMLNDLYRPIVAAANDRISAQGYQRAFEFVCPGSTAHSFSAIVLHPHQVETLSRILNPKVQTRSTAWLRRVSNFAEERQTWMKRLRQEKTHEHPLGHDDEVGENLVLERIDFTAPNGEICLTVAGGSYGAIVRTSDSLINEFAVFAYLCSKEHSRQWGPAILRIGKKIRMRPVEVLRELPWRREIHSWEDEPADILLRPRGRAAGLGVAVTIIPDTAKDPGAYVGRRSLKVGTYPGAWHVIPAGMCNAPGLEFMVRAGLGLMPDQLRWTMLSELLEECFDQAEFSDVRTDHWRDRVVRECKARGIAVTAPEYTGLAIDLLNLRPEVCGSIELREDLVKTICWEYDKLEGLQLVPLSEIARFCKRGNFVQSGAASLLLAHSRGIGKTNKL
jgi:hypothetical protein